MNLDHRAKYYTLDYDRCTYKRLLAWLFWILLDKDTKRLMYRRSPRRKGYHVFVRTKHEVVVAKKRRKFRDDPRRLVHDLLNRPSHIHDVLWSQKRVKGKVYKAGKWSEWIY